MVIWERVLRPSCLLQVCNAAVFLALFGREGVGWTYVAGQGPRVAIFFWMTGLSPLNDGLITPQEHHSVRAIRVLFVRHSLNRVFVLDLVSRVHAN
jgi:hypothetical protein